MFNIFKKNKKIITHNGTFHPDDVFACATLSLYLEKNNFRCKIKRTRNEDIIKKGDLVVDVGGIYNPNINRFDHHQKEGAGKRENGVPYAGFGLVWKHFGEQVCDSKEVAEKIDKKLAQPIDAEDNGVVISSSIIDDVLPYDIYNIVGLYLPEDRDGNECDSNFLELVKWARFVLLAEIKKEKYKAESAEKVIKYYNNTKDKRVIIIGENCPWRDTLSKYPEPLFVVTQNAKDSWAVNTVRVDKNSFENRKNLPEKWAGLQDKELQDITGVPGAVFCHRNLFLAIVKTKEGAIRLSELALKN